MEKALEIICLTDLHPSYS